MFGKTKQKQFVMIHSQKHFIQVLLINALNYNKNMFFIISKNI